MRIQRVILAADDNPQYRPFLPLAVRAWSGVVGLRPTIAIVGEGGGIDSASADVVRLAPIPGIPTDLQAQVSRLLVPALFPDDVSLISDVDLVPLSRQYFPASVRRVPDDRFVVYRDAAYDPGTQQYPMCYCAARGRTFGEIFDVRGAEDFEPAIRRWAGLDWGWFTDERVLFRAVNEWHARTGRLERLGDHVRWRVDRGDWKYSPLRALCGLYIDAHLPRPYADHRADIDRLVDLSQRGTRAIQDSIAAAVWRALAIRDGGRRWVRAAGIRSAGVRAPAS